MNGQHVIQTRLGKVHHSLVSKRASRKIDFRTSNNKVYNIYNVQSERIEKYTRTLRKKDETSKVPFN